MYICLCIYIGVAPRSSNCHFFIFSQNHNFWSNFRFSLDTLGTPNLVPHLPSISYISYYKDTSFGAVLGQISWRPWGPIGPRKGPAGGRHQPKKLPKNCTQLLGPGYMEYIYTHTYIYIYTYTCFNMNDNIKRLINNQRNQEQFI